MAVIEVGLLSAVAAGAAAGGFDNLCVRRVDFDLGDVGSIVGCGESLNVLRKERESGLIVVLAEEVGVADGFRGKGSVEGAGGRDQEKR